MEKLKYQFFIVESFAKERCITYEHFRFELLEKRKDLKMIALNEKDEVVSTEYFYFKQD